MVQKDEEVPADLLLVYSSKKEGLVFVDTMNLDGETNLKEKMIISNQFNEPIVAKLFGSVSCDMPNENLDYWEGVLSSPKLKKEYPAQ